MVATIRAAGIRDREAILRLRALSFPEDDAEKGDPDFWNWEFGRERVRVFVAEEDGECLAHVALIPQGHVVEGRAVESAMAVDAMTHPGRRRGGLYSRVVEGALEATLDQVSLLTAFQIRPEVLGSMLRTGWAIRASAPVFLRPASFRSFFGSGGQRGRRDLVDLPATHPDVRLLSGNDVSRMTEVAASMFDARDIHLHRSEEFLRWRFFSNPFWQYRVTGIHAGKKLMAYLIARRSTLRGMDTVAIADLGFRPGSSYAMRVLIGDSIRVARIGGCRLIASLLSRHHPALGSLLRRGFVPGPHRFRLLTRTRDGALDERLAKGHWRISWADTDHL